MWLIITPGGKAYRHETHANAVDFADWIASRGRELGFFPYKCRVRKFGEVKP